MRIAFFLIKSGDFLFPLSLRLEPLPKVEKGCFLLNVDFFYYGFDKMKNYFKTVKSASTEPEINCRKKWSREKES
ncbi:hypothetical protein A7Q09_08365 [Methylacidiphilum sp. Yel]|nr:hypothetical protein A7Q09_08365 [Methylacidiphilum sp. Yel]